MRDCFFYEEVNKWVNYEVEKIFSPPKTSLGFSKMKDNKNILFCSCGAECLVLERFDEDTKHRSSVISEYDELFISLFQFPLYAQPYSIWGRIKYAFHILWTGKPYYDQVVLEKEEIDKLKNWLNSNFR